MVSPSSPPRIIGHRGAAAHAPENTLAGFRKARALGAHWVEFDVQATRDDRAVLLHDARLERTTDGYGIAADRSAGEIERLDAGRWFGPSFRGEKVPSLEAALALLDELGLGAVIEVKAAPGDGPRTMRATLAALDRCGAPETFVLSSFDEAALAFAAAAAPAIPRALIVKSIPADWRARLARLGAGALHAGERGIDAVTVREVASSCPLRVFTVNAPERARALFAWGAAAVFTDRPDVIISALGHNSEPLAPVRLVGE
ncbi:MAG TPA: glycerophosphodiester phosphodiesterase family protein [Stellaceae bacterium]|nr:glycerophosphodiester phosphodiesterase family protein [Stellaceae bacterium]